MNKLVMIVAMSIWTAGCSAQDIQGDYERQSMSQFDEQHNMNTSLTIVKGGDDYVLTLHSGYGNVAHPAKLEKGKLIMDNDLVGEFEDKKLKLYYQENPSVVYVFKHKQ